MKKYLILDLLDEIYGPFNDNREAYLKQAQKNFDYIKIKSHPLSSSLMIGISFSYCRKLAKKYKDIPLENVGPLFKANNVHELKYIGFHIVREKYEKAKTKKEKKQLFDFTIKNIYYLDNWDLIDTFAPYVIGDYLKDKDKILLHYLALNPNFWIRRIAIVSTLAYIKENKFNDAFEIAKILLLDKEDLVQKPIGRILREIGKRNKQALKYFLEHNLPKISNTTLRYAMEKFDEEEKAYFYKYKKYFNF